MKGAIVGVVLGVGCGVFIACSASQKTSSVAPVSPAAGGAPHDESPPMPGSPGEQQIYELWKQLDADRVQLALPAPMTAFSCNGPSCADGAQAMAAAAITPTLVCKPAPTDTCTQSCTLADSICSNSKQICELAAKLDGDQWAAKKCSDGTETCNAAKSRCCGCGK